MKRPICALTLAALMALPGLPTLPAEAASHREAPLIANDPAADITDFYAFRSWVDPNKVVFIMNVIPAQEPSAGPNYFNFSDDVVYAIHLTVRSNWERLLRITTPRHFNNLARMGLQVHRNSSYNWRTSSS